MSMNEIFQWLGLAAAYLIAGLTAWGFFNWSVEAITVLHGRIERAFAYRVRSEVGREISAIAHWFTQDTGAWKALQAVGESLNTRPDLRRLDGDEIRELWRAKCRELENQTDNGGKS